jgi:hypothetical protein
MFRGRLMVLVAFSAGSMNRLIELFAPWRAETGMIRLLGGAWSVTRSVL